METRSMKKQRDEANSAEERPHEVNALLMCVKEIERLGQINKKLLEEHKQLKSLLYNSTSIKEKATQQKRNLKQKLQLRRSKRRKLKPTAFGFN